VLLIIKVLILYAGNVVICRSSNQNCFLYMRVSSCLNFLQWTLTLNVTESTISNGTPILIPKHEDSMELMRMLMQHMMTPMTQNVLPLLLRRRFSSMSVGRNY